MPLRQLLTLTHRVAHTAPDAAQIANRDQLIWLIYLYLNQKTIAADRGQNEGPAFAGRCGEARKTEAKQFFFI